MRYSAFGLGVSTSAPIPRLAGAASTRPADLHIELRRRPDWLQRASLARVRYDSVHRDAASVPMLSLGEFDNGWLRLSFADGAEFFIDPSGAELWADWPDSLTIDDASSYLLGPVMGLVLRLRGRVCLHASAVAVDGRAIALIGPPGAGKSTAAAAFAASGCAVLADDVVALQEINGRFDAQPGYPRLRLWPRSVEALGRMSAGAPELPPDWGERRYHLDLPESGYMFQSEPLPLSAVYSLGERSSDPGAPAISPLAGSDALIALVSHSFGSPLLDRDLRAHDLRTLGRLAGVLPVRAIAPHASLERLPALVDAIRADLKSLPRPGLLAACAE